MKPFHILGQLFTQLPLHINLEVELMGEHG